MTFKDSLEATLDKERTELERQLAALPRKQALIQALPDKLSDHCAPETLRLSLGHGWLSEGTLKGHVPSSKAVLALLELLPPVPVSLYQSSTFCFGPDECHKEITKSDGQHKVTPVFPVTFRKGGLADEFQWWTRLGDTLLCIQMDLVARRTRTVGNGHQDSGDITRWLISGLPGGNAMAVGSCTARYAGDVCVYWGRDADLKVELAKNQELYRSVH